MMTGMCIFLWDQYFVQQINVSIGSVHYSNKDRKNEGSDKFWYLCRMYISQFYTQIGEFLAFLNLNPQARIPTFPKGWRKKKNE